VLNNNPFGVEIPEEKPTEISFRVEFVEGQNSLIVNATSVDGTKTEAAEEVSNTTIETTPVQPTISIEKSEDGLKAIMKASHESGIKEVKFNVNDVDYIVEIGENPKELQFEFDLLDGNNKITFTAIPTEGIERQEVLEITK